MKRIPNNNNNNYKTRTRDDVRRFFERVYKKTGINEFFLKFFFFLNLTASRNDRFKCERSAMFHPGERENRIEFYSCCM